LTAIKAELVNEVTAHGFLPNNLVTKQRQDVFADLYALLQKHNWKNDEIGFAKLPSAMFILDLQEFERKFVEFP
jgi:hypothetical protein